MRCRWLPLLAVALLVACSDDGEGPTPDGPGKTDQTVIDQGPIADQAPVADQAPATDGVPDGAPANTFNIELTVGYGILVGCSAGNADKDCVGDIYWSVYDVVPPTDPNNPGTPIFQGLHPNGKKGDVIKGAVPVAAQLWVAAFQDDNNNVNVSATKPDLGDPVHSDAQPFTAQAGQTITRNLTFDLRMPF